MAQRFNKSPSDYWGFTDRRLITDFDRLHNLRAQLHENERARAEAAAMRGEAEIEDPRIVTSGEGIKFPMPVN